MADAQPIPGGNQPTFDAGPIAGGNAPVEKSNVAIPPLNPRHSAGPGKTMTPPKLAEEQPEGFTENDFEDIRKMAQESGFMDSEGPANDELDPEEEAELGQPTPDEDEVLAAEADTDAEDDGTGGSRSEEKGSDEQEVIAVSEDELDELVFKTKGRDGDEEVVSLRTLISERVKREDYLRDKQKVHEAVQTASRREAEAAETVQYYKDIVEAALVPHEYIAVYLDNHVKNGNVPASLRDAIVAAFQDTENFGYKADEVKRKASAMLDEARQREEVERQSQEKRLARVRGDMVTIKDKYNNGQWLTDAQVDLLRQKMELMQRERGYEFVAPLEAYLIYREEIIGKPQPKRVIGKSRQAAITRLQQRRSNVPAPGSGAAPTSREPSLASLAAEAEKEVRRFARR